MTRPDRRGAPVRFDVRDGIDDGIGEGVVHLVEAHAADGPAGYVKLSYVEAARADRLYPDALHWWVRRRHHHVALGPLLDLGEDHWGPDEHRRALAATDGWTSRAREEIAAERTDASVAARWEARRAEVTDRARADHERFRAFHVDRPLVDFIEVYGDGGHSRPYVDGRRVDVPVTDHRRRGIGVLLYEVAALSMAARGLHLHASRLQSGAAQGVWDAMVARGIVVDAPGAPGRRTIDVGRLLDDAPSELRTCAREIDAMHARVRASVAAASLLPVTRYS